MPRPNPLSALANTRRQFRPATSAALKMYASGGARTIREAANAYGLAASSLYVAKRSIEGQMLMEGIQDKVEERAIDATALIAKLSVEMVNKVATLARSAGSENIQLAAAKDLLDRNPETSKTQKVALEGFSIGQDDAKHLAEAMVRAAQVRAGVGDRAKGDFLKIVGPGTEVQPATEVPSAG